MPLNVLFRETLVSILDVLNVPEGLGARRLALRANMESATDTESLTAVAQELMDLMVELAVRADDERRVVESFLDQLSARFSGLEQALQQAGQMTSASYQGSHKSRVALERQIDEIESRLRQSANPEQIRASVHQRVGVIRTQLDHDHGKRAVQHTSLQAQMNSLESTLRSLAQEAVALRAQFDPENLRVAVDAVTGLPTRHAYEQRLHQEFARWKRYATPLLLQRWNVDGYDAVARVHGAEVAERALIVVADLLRKSLRETDYVARYDQTGFAVLLPETGLDAAELIAERLRHTIAASRFHYLGEAVQIRVSCGSSALQDDDTPRRALERAQLALQQGRDDDVLSLSAG